MSYRLHAVYNIYIFTLINCATSRTVLGSIPGDVTGVFSVAPLDGTMCPEVDSASDNEYHGFLLG